MKKIVGIKEQFGEYEDRPYHNIYFHCAEEFDKDKSSGLETSVIKVKYDILTESFGKALNTSEIFSLIGKIIEVYYDKYQSVKLVDIQDSTPTSAKNDAKA